MTLTKGNIIDAIPHINRILNELAYYRFYTLMKRRVSKINLYKDNREYIKQEKIIIMPKQFSLSSISDVCMQTTLKACVIWSSLLKALSNIEKELSRFPNIKDNTTILVIPHASTIKGCVNEDGVPYLSLTTLAERKLERLMRNIENDSIVKSILDDL